ncbi:MAG: hypothetical protein GY781_13755 [Gammaproteobacteria bacterium]|nr:hypothetical protein [Gammaproteobacteria bacterium]
MWTIQSNFTKGEIDPQAVARIDLNSYYQGLYIARNVICIPQGGMKKRPGMQYLNDADSTALRLEAFSFSTDVNYIVEFSDAEVRFYNTNGTVADTVATPWGTSDIPDLDYIQSYDTIIVVHPDYEPRRIVRNSPTDFAISALPIENIPKNNFNDSQSPVGTPEIQRVEYNGTWNSGDTYVITFNGITTDAIAYSGSANTTQQSASAKNLEDGLNALPNIGGDGVTVAYESGTDYLVTFAANSAPEWGLLTGITENSASATANIRVQDRVQEGVTTFEDSWSNTRGWPQTATFHENRLWFGGSSSLPATVWGSNVNSFFDFRSFKDRDDESITATLDTDQRNEIVGILSNRALQIFTTGQEFYVPESPITPENIAVRAQTNFGSKRVRPVTLSGQTMFIQRTGKSLNSFVYSEDQNANVTSSISILSPHLIKDPIKLTIQRGAPDSDANYIYIVNDDGTVTVLNSLPFENIAAFTRWETDGNILSAAVAGEQVYFLAERNGSRFLEIENDSLNMDSGEIRTGSIDVVTGISRMNGQDIAIKTDGYFYGVESVSVGEVSLGNTYSEVEFGYEFYPEMTTMPMNVNLKTGSALYKKKRLKRVALDIYESNGIIVNGNRIYDKTIGINQFDAPSPISGVKRRYLYGWSVVADITVNQNTPFPFQILSIGVEVAL